ncbi:hypothetical protein F5B20DRAFT_49623 [Whalleya microplaca]|nr:hypothetical protein F5B20DRAFT_49623 [Whalleya microplaca]
MAGKILAGMVELIPWDHRSDEHVDRMVLQRRECGWFAEDVPEWKERSETGHKSLFWVTLSDSVPGQEEMLQAHTVRFPKEKVPLRDTATSINLLPCEATKKEFITLGHVALNKHPTPDLESHLADLPPEGVYWVANLYVSWALQSRGLGRAVMVTLEATVVREPLNGRVMALDTVQKEFQLSDMAAENFWKPMGMPMPRFSNEEWYQKQGYTIFRRLDGHRSLELPTGDVVSISLILLKKDLI